MSSVTWSLTSGTGNWSATSDWTPALPADGDSVVIGTTTNSSSIVVTEDVTISINSLVTAGRSGRTTTLAITPGAMLTVNGAVSLGANTDIDGTGTLIVNGAISGGGSITASSGLLDISGTGSIATGGAVLSIGTTVASTLELNLSGGISTRAISINNANQTLEVGPAGTLNITTGQDVANGTVLMAGGTLGDSSGITVGTSLTSGTLTGFGTVTANLSRSGTGTADTIMASGGTLDLKGKVGSGLVLAIGSSAPTDLKIDSTAVAATPIALNSVNQTLEIGTAGTLTIQSAESITNGTIQLDGGTLTDSSGLSIGAGATLIGTGRVSGVLSGTGTVEADGGTLDLVSAVSSTSTDFSIDDVAGSVLKLAGAATSGTFTFAGSVGTLELADVTGGVVRGFDGTIAGLNVGTSTTNPTNDVNIQGTVTSAFLSGSQITVLNGTTTVATLLLGSAPGAGVNAFISTDNTLGGYDVFLANAAVALPTVSWSPGSETGVEGSAIALGTITATAGAVPLNSVLVNNIPVGDRLTDGAGHSFTATAGTTSVNVLHWNDASLSITPTNDANFTLSVQAIDLAGNASTIATEALTVDPLAPTVAPRNVSGTHSAPITLNLGIAVNSKTGDTNSLNSVTLSGIPTTGATLSDSAGPLIVTSGSISFTAAQLSAGALTGLAITLANPGTYSLGVSAIEHDANGDLSAAAIGTETVTVTGPTVSWSPASETGVEGSAITLGTITAAGGGHPLTSVLVSNIPVGDKLTDGAGGHSFTATAGTTSVNVLSWRDTSLSITPINDGTVTLSVQATDSLGLASATATEALTVDPLAPTVTPVAVSGVQDQAIALNLGIVVNSKPGDTNSLNSVTLSGIPAGATLSDSAGPLAVSGGSISFTATQITASALTDLAIMLANTGTVDLGVTATEQDASGKLVSTAVSGTETVTVTAATGPTVSWSPASETGIEGSAIALGTINATAGANPLTSVVVSNIPVGDTLSDGAGGHSFTATAGTTSANVLGWTDTSLSLTPVNDGTITLSVRATDSVGNASTVSGETLTVDPEAPTVAPVAISGVQGQAIALDLGITPSNPPGDSNVLNSVTISGIPATGATLTDGAGTLAASGGSVVLAGSTLDAALSSLAITLANAGTIDLGVSATEQDASGNLISAAGTGTETVIATAAAPPTVSWSPASETGVEGSAIALGTITATAGANPLTSVVVSGILLGDTLSDGAGGHSFTATAGTTSVNVLGWTDTSLSLTPVNDGTVTLAVQATDTVGNTSTIAGETLTVDPEAPTVAPVAVSGTQGQPIALNLGLAVNGLNGDANTLATVTLSGIPPGATLSNTNGDTLTITSGSITFNTVQLAGGVLNGLALTVPSAGTYTLGVNATEQDAERNLSGTASGSEQVAVSAPAPAVPAYSHIVVVFEEYQPYQYNPVDKNPAGGADGIVGNPAAPYINNTLIPGGALLTNYFGITYPFTEPNYLAAYAGSTFGITNGGTYSLPDPTLDTILTGAGKTFTGYVESQNPAQDVWLSFPEGDSVQQNFTAFPSGNFANLPTVSFVTPNLIDDMDNGSVAQGDSWLSNNIGAYAQWALNNNSLLIVTTTQDDGTEVNQGGTETNQVATILYGDNVTPGTSSTHYNNYDLLNTLLAGYGLTAPNNAASAAPIQVFNTSTGTGSPPSVSWSATTVSGPEGQVISPGTITPSSIALGTITPSSSNPLQSLVLSGIPVGATLSDGMHTFTATLGSTAVNILSWNYSNLSITPSNDGDMSLIAQATDSSGNRSAAAIETVTVSPPPPTVAPLVSTGIQGQPIALIPGGVTLNGLSGDNNSLYSLTLSGIPSGSTLSNTNGDTLAASNGSITFDAAQLASGVLNGLAMTVGNSGTYTLGVSAIEQDAEGDLSASGSGSETVTALPPSTVPTYSHIVVVVDENQDYDSIVGSSSAPYINNTLIAGGALLTNFWAPTHPSEPDHLALYAGSTFGVTDNGVNTLPDPTLDTILGNAGKTFVGYAESPDTWGLDPWKNFPEGTSVEQNFTAFPQGNFASLPTVSMVIPNLDDNMHDGTVAQGDTWLQNNLSAYAQWAANPANNSLLIVTWDENGAEVPPEPNQVAGIFYGAGVVPGAYGTPYNFYNLLSTLVDGYNQVGPNYAAQQSPIPVFDPPSNVFTLDSSNTSLVLTGPNNMVFLNGATGATITDDPSGLDHLDLVAEPSGGSVSISNFGPGTGSEVDLPLGFGGLENSSQALALLKPDQHGGTMLNVGSQLSVDFRNVAPSLFQPDNFRFS